MGLPTSRILTSLLLLMACGLEAQDEAYKAQLQLNYKRFTRGNDAKVVDEAHGRLEWFRERMGGELGSDFTQHLLREAEKERAKYPRLFPAPGAPLLPVALNGTTWVNLGPMTAAFAQNGLTLNKVDSGRLRAILPDTTDATGNTVYVLASGGGLWKTTNFLNATPSWTPLTDRIGSTVSGAAAFGRVTSTLFVGAGDPFDAGLGGFMVKSTDGGGTWSPSIQLGTASKIYDIKVDASQALDIVLVGTNTGLYRSTDAGATYAAVASIPASSKVWGLVKTSAGWLASITQTTTLGNTTTTSGSLYLSPDRGATWIAITSTALNLSGRMTLGIGQPDDAVVYAYAANTNNAAQRDLLRSTDGGQIWTALGVTSKVPTNSNTDNGTMDLMDGQAWYNHMILVDPTDPARNTVYLGGQLGSAKTTDGGVTWRLLSNWMAQYGLPYVHADFHCAAFSNLAGTPRLYFGTDGGLFTSTNGGTTWDDTKNKGLASHLIYALAANPGVAGSALVGMQDNGTRIRSGTTFTFNQVRGGDGFGVGWAQGVTGPNAVSLSSYVHNSIERATTSPVVNQNNWGSFTSGLGVTGNDDAGANYYFVTPIITPPAGADPTGQVFYTYGNSGSGKVFQSDATGWSTIGTAGTAGLSAGRYVRAVSHGIGISPTDLQHVAAAGNGGYLLLTANGGSLWNEVFLGALDVNGNQVAGSLVTGWQGYNANIAWANNSVLYVCSEATAPGAIRVAKSVNGGSTWVAAATGLPDVPVTKLAVDPGDGTGNTVYAATWLGVYRTTNGGSTWSIFGAGLPQGRVTDIWVAPDSSSIRVSTWGRGVWEMTNAAVAGTVNLTPATAFLYTGDTAMFTGTVNGGGPVTYTATGGTITSGGTYTAGTAAGDFTVTATSAADANQKAVANVTIAVPVPVSFTTQPQSLTAAEGHQATFAVVASGSGTLTYQWKKGGIAIPSATAASYTTPALTLGDTGAIFTCEVTGRAGMVPSNPATLTVKPLGAAVAVSSSTLTAIPDATSSTPGAAVEVPFSIAGVNGNIGEVTFSVYLTHTYVGDLVLTLLAPDGSSVILSDMAGSNGTTTSPTGAAFGTSCGTYTVFSDLGATSISSQASPPAIVGTYRPSFPLNAFNGRNANGTWKLRIQDFGPQDVGNFVCGTLSVKPFLVASLDVNADGVIDVRDLLVLAKHFGTVNTACNLDGSPDGQVTDADLTILLGGL